MSQITNASVVRGRMAPGEVRATSVHGRGRVCRAAECDTVLSMYNATGSCWQHEEPHTYVLQAPRKKRRDARVA
ncbi:MAG: hypothetical protein ACAH81_11395 [Actinomycetota bacterium]|jgi:hypothetical protein